MKKAVAQGVRTYPLGDVRRVRCLGHDAMELARADSLQRMLRDPLPRGGVDIRVIQALLGHAKLDNIIFYTRVATRTVRAVTSPLDKLGTLRIGEHAEGG